MVLIADPPRNQPRPPRRQQVGRAWIAVVAVVLCGMAIVVQRLLTDQDGAPYPASAIHATVHLQLVDATHVQAVVDALAGPERLSVPVATSGGPWAGQVIIGQLRLRTPDNAPALGQYALFVIDNDEHQPVPDMWAVGPAGSNVGQGWDGAYDQLAASYAWLRPLAEIHDDDGTFSDPGSAVSFPPDTASPVTFAAMLPRNSLPITDPGRQLTLALAFLSPDGQVYWAQQLTA